MCKRLHIVFQNSFRDMLAKMLSVLGTHGRNLVFQDFSLGSSKLRGPIATIKRFTAFHNRTNQITCLGFFFPTVSSNTFLSIRSGCLKPFPKRKKKARE